MKINSSTSSNSQNSSVWLFSKTTLAHHLILACLLLGPVMCSVMVTMVYRELLWILLLTVDCEPILHVGVTRQSLLLHNMFQRPVLPGCPHLAIRGQLPACMNRHHSTVIPFWLIFICTAIRLTFIPAFRMQISVSVTPHNNSVHTHTHTQFYLHQTGSYMHKPHWNYVVFDKLLMKILSFFFSAVSRLYKIDR